MLLRELARVSIIGSNGFSSPASRSGVVAVHRGSGVVGTWERGEKCKVKDWLKGSDQSFWVEVVIYLPVFQFLTLPPASLLLPRCNGDSGGWRDGTSARERGKRDTQSERLAEGK
ncbi:hypothetical protein AOXY_G27875 [Acipenser oxyrinchus oxyrinchus]|uniref:Uncharacterized protein n=1 Tax=Acipenser oxyrinchus oxyrinchus TaxID=40147 RepID=A0AAD8FV00_ACIOX|nr:hypothetical protein AOXY_G27875 [Acipenser oxyrinchus oxyrinchus]